MENGPFEDVFPSEHGDIPASYVSLPEGIPFERARFHIRAGQTIFSWI